MPFGNSGTVVDIGTAPVFPPKPPEDTPEFAYENLSSLTRLGRSFNRGQLQIQQGKVASEIRDQGITQERQVRYDSLKNQIDALGGDGSGFTGFLASASEVLGQMEASVADPRMAVSTAAGAAAGGAIGAIGGPAAGVTAGAGAGVGAVYHLALNSFEVESGLSYTEQLEAGVDPGVAYWTSFGVGLGNAALEMTGLKFVAAPFKKLLVKEAVKDPRVVAQIGRAAAAYGGAIAGETGTEILQEALSIMGEEVGKSLSDVEGADLPELTDRMAQIFVKTLSAMSVLAVPGIGASVIADRRRARQAVKNSENLDILKERVDELPKETAQATTESALEQSGLTEVYIPAQELVNAANALPDPTELYRTLGADGAFVAAIEDAATLGGDVRLDQRRFTALLQSDLFTNLAEHIRFDLDGMTAFEEQEYKEREAALLKEVDETTAPETDVALTITPFEPDDLYRQVQLPDGNAVVEAVRRDNGVWKVTMSELPEQLQGQGLGIQAYKTLFDGLFAEGATEITSDEAVSEEAARVYKSLSTKGFNVVETEQVPGKRQPRFRVTKTVTTLAEAELGLQALFRTAKDAGLSEKQYEAYLVAIQKAADQRNTAGERNRLRQESAENKGEIKRLREELAETAREHLSSLPVYQALQGIGKDRLDRSAVAEIIGEKELENLPKSQGKNIFGTKNEKGIDPELYADLYGFEGADIMLFSMLDAKPFDEAVATESDRLFTERHEGLSKKQADLEQQIEDLHNDSQAQVLALELNALREAVEGKKLKPAQVKAAAKDRLRDYKLKDITPKKFYQTERRMAKKAASLLRKGDRAGAAQAKFQQLVNFYMAQEAYKVLQKTASQRKYFKNFLRTPKAGAKLPIDYRNIIVTMLGVINLNKPFTLKQLVAQKQAADGVILAIPVGVLEKDGRQHFQDLTLRDWENLHHEVKNVEKQGLDENKLFREHEKETREEIVAGVVENTRANLKNREGEVTETAWENSRDWARGMRSLLYSVDTILKQMDGWTSLGKAYAAIKRPYDWAMTRGYLSGQKGYVHRMKKESERLNKLYGIYSKKEQVSIRKKVNVPGVGRMSHARQISILLNLGNLENRLALTESKQFTEEQLDAVVANMSEKDFRFVQGVWDFLEEFWPEVRDSAKRRRNQDPERVEATSVETPHGTLRGGYYPLSYEAKRAEMIPIANSSDVQQILELMRFGQFTTMMTRHGHTQERVGSAGRAVRLDPFVLNSHVNQVVYDLEVGDALIDVYKVLYHRNTQRTFQNMNQTHKLEQLQIWFADVVVGEMHFGDATEKFWRHIRTGRSIAALTYSPGSALLQATGVFQSAVLVGKANMVRGMVQASWPTTYTAVRQQSSFMATRELSFNREVAEAQQAMSSGWVRRATPGETARWLSHMAFYALVKIQGFTDMATWIAAKRQGMKLFEGNHDRSVEHADRAVARAQASGIFGDRTALERGSTSKRVQQTEVVRSLVPFIGYFLAKTNVAYERVRSTKLNSNPFVNAVRVLDLLIDLMLIYMVDGVMAALVYGHWPEDEEDIPGFLVAQSVLSVLGGIYGFRDVVSEVQGFQGGGATAAFYGDAGKFGMQLGQGEIDAALVKSGARVVGTVARIPGTNTIIRLGDAEYRRQQGEDVTIMEYLFGAGWRED